MKCRYCKNEIVITKGQVRKDYDFHKKCFPKNKKKVRTPIIPMYQS